jgi:UDP-2-acetamido-3-amino-2,3-dideoxy-glucuronate N-acetyltransferase
VVLSSSSLPRIGQIGAGYWGKNLARNFAALGVLDALADTDRAALQALGDKHRIAALYESPKALLADPAVDAVVIATPAISHGPLAAAALAAGKHVFVEKPLCLDLAEAKRLGEAADRRGLTLMVGHLLHYHPAFRALLAAIREGRIGQIRYIYSHRLSLGKIRREESALWSFAPHDISMILSIVGALPERVLSSGGNYLSPTVADTSLSHFSFPRNIQAHVFVSWLHPYKDHRLVTVGSEGMLVFDDAVAGPEKLRLFSHGVGWDGQLPLISKATPEFIPYAGDEPLALECRHFLECIAGKKRPITDAEEGLRVLSVLDACQRSLTTGAATAPSLP